MYGSPSYGAFPQVPVAAVEYGRVTDIAMINGAGPAPDRANYAGAALGNSAANAANRGEYPYNTTSAVYRVWIQTDSGALRTYDVQATGNLRPGDRLRIENGVIYLS